MHSLDNRVRSLTPKSSQRPWRVIARELATETNAQRILALSSELDCALEEQGLDHDEEDQAS